MNTDTADLLEQFIALHKDSPDPYIQERVGWARKQLNEIDSERARRFIEQVLREGQTT